MSRLEELPPDQRAALSLLLGQRKSYAELAHVLGISETAVHDRAHAALAVLAPRKARDVPAERRAEIADYLLGQQSGLSERLATRTFLGTHTPARAWARELAGQLAPLTSEPLPDIPDGPVPGLDGGPSDAEPSTTTNGRAGGSLPDAGRPLGASLPSSRLGGALLLGGIVAIIVVVVLLVTGGGGGASHGKASSGASASSTAASGGSGPKVANRLTLRSPSGSSAIGVVNILSEGTKRAFYMAAEHLPPSRGFYYAIWLYNSPTTFEPLSRGPTVSSNGRLAGGALLPSNAGNYHEMLLTRETAGRPTRPGPTVLQGAFSLGE